MCARFRNIAIRDQYAKRNANAPFRCPQLDAKVFYWIDAPLPRQAVIEAAAKVWDRAEHEFVNSVETDFKENHARFSCSPVETAVDYPTLSRLAMIYPSLLAIPKWRCQKRHVPERHTITFLISS